MLKFGTGRSSSGTLQTKQDHGHHPSLNCHSKILSPLKYIISHIYFRIQLHQVRVNYLFFLDTLRNDVIYLFIYLFFHSPGIQNILKKGKSHIPGPIYDAMDGKEINRVSKTQITSVYLMRLNNYLFKLCSKDIFIMLKLQTRCVLFTCRKRLVSISAREWDYLYLRTSKRIIIPPT